MPLARLQVRHLMKRVEILEHPRLAMRAEMLAELHRQRTEGARLAAEFARCAAAGKAAVRQAEECVLALYTEISEKSGVNSMKEGHDVERVTVESDVVKDTVSTTVKPAEKYYDSGSRPTAECQLVRRPRKRRATREAEGKKEVTSVEGRHDVERVTAERNDVAKDTMSAEASSRKRWMSLTPASRPQRLR